MKLKWPNQKRFAFTIVDDTDNAYCCNIKPVYDLLNECGIYTTKTVWVKPPRDRFTGQCLEDDEYLNFIKELQGNGFEIALHSIGAGYFTRDEILEAFEKFKALIGNYPTIQINHYQNSDSLYWGYERYVQPLRWLYQIIYGVKRTYYGTNPKSNCFWGDVSKREIKFIRNHIFNGINTLKYDPQMPYRDKGKKKYSNYWFSSSDAYKVEAFNNLVNSKNVNLLENDGGACIVYTHFAEGFVDEKGYLNPNFEKNIRYLSGKNGWFVPASDLLNYLLNNQINNNFVSYWYLLKLDFFWLLGRLINRIKYG